MATIEINQADGPIDFNGYSIYVDGKKVFNERERGISRTFSESDIYDLLSSKQYAQFEDGKSLFKMTKKSFNEFNRLPY